MATATWGCGKLGRMKIPSPVLLGWLLASACATTSPTAAAATDAPPSSSAQGGQPQTDEQKTLYALGLSVGRSLSVFNLTNEELEYVRAGIYAQAKGETPAVDITTWGPKIQGLAAARQAARAGSEKEKGK